MAREPQRHTDYLPGYTDELAERLVRVARELRVREIDWPQAYLGTAYAASDLVRDLDEALRNGAPVPKRWAPGDLTGLPWRQGRHVGRHLYAQLGPEPSDDDPVIGALDTAELAAEACEAHNERLAARGTDGT
jgi:hypothetical protein